MRRRTLTSLAAAALLALSAASPAAAADTAHYYVSFGDSLSVGYQPGMGNTSTGYTDDLYTALKAKDPSLQHVKLGCAGETTTTLLNGGICTYPEGSQIKAAAAFLKAHRGAVTYVTLDIGANDVQHCLVGGAIDPGCLLTGLRSVVTNLPQITARLRLAAGAGPRFAAMTYYDPFLVAWLKGSSGQSLARESVLLGDLLNALETGVYKVSGFTIADVAAAFATNDFGHPETVPGLGELPRNVARICTWTWECSKGDIHANDVGYQQIAGTFAAALKI